MSKLSEMTSVELFSKFYTQSLTAAAHIQVALLGICSDVVKSVESTGTPDVSDVQALVNFMLKKDPDAKLVQTNSILGWITDVAGFRVSKTSIVRAGRFTHDRDWFDTVRSSKSWSEHGKAMQQPKPVSDPTDQIVRQMATYVAMGGMVLSDLEVGMPLIVGKVKAMLKDPNFIEKIEDRMTKLDEKGLDYVKA